jgi:hypothetical protein
MTSTTIRVRPRLAAAAAALLVVAAVAAAEADQGKKAILWKDPGNIGALDLFWGSGAAARAPQGPFTFVKEDTGGVQPKIDVRDSAGREWDVKFGEEVHAEIAANRLVWALGFVAEESYFVPKGTVNGVPAGKMKDFIAPDGTFTNASFRLRGEGSKRAEERWTFEDNPFVNTPELSGLAILMTMLCNWDIQGTRNNRILQVDGDDRYIVSDLGATFGKMGKFPVPRSKWSLEDFRKEEFIEKVEDGQIDLDYEGYGGINKVSVEHARWFSRLASQLTDDQLRAALRASGATDAEAAGFSARLREKITELQKAVGTDPAVR